MTKSILSILAFVLCAAASICFGGSHAETNKGHAALLKAIVLGMGRDGRTATGPRYDGMFRQGNAVEGVLSVIRAERFYINGYARYVREPQPSNPDT